MKYANLQANPKVLVLAGDTAWERGLDVVIEGTAVPVTDEALLRRLAELYRGRWDGRGRLDIQHGAVAPRTPGTQLVVFEVTPNTARGHGKGYSFSHTAYRFRHRARHSSQRRHAASAHRRRPQEAELPQGTGRPPGRPTPSNW